MKKIIFCILSIVMILSYTTCGITASDIVTESQNEVLYTREQLAIFDKIDDLAVAKAAVLQYKTMHNLIDNNNDYVYSALVAEADSIRNELIEMGAKPSTEELASLKFEPVEVNGVLIDDFADFEETYGGVYDLWGVEHTVNATYGTYYTYDIMIQDVKGGEILSTSISQNQRPGWELHTSSSSISSLIEDAINSVAIDRLVESIAAGVGHTNWTTGAYTTLKSIFNIVSGINPNDPITVTGNTSSHIIFCDIVPTIHFVFVRDSLTGPWKHSLTTNKAEVLETHNLYYVISQNGSPVVINDNSYSYDDLLLPEDYGFRLTNAISAYRYNNSLYVDKLSGYTVIVKENAADLEGEEAFTLSITCPENQFDLFDADYNNYQIKIAIIVSAIVVCSLIAVIAFRRKKHK